MKKNFDTIDAIIMAGDTLTVLATVTGIVFVANSLREGRIPASVEQALRLTMVAGVNIRAIGTVGKVFRDAKNSISEAFDYTSDDLEMELKIV